MTAIFSRRVVVTGLGAVSPLGLGAARSWNNLMAGNCGIKPITQDYGDFSKNDSKVAGLVPKGSKSDGKWLTSDWFGKDDQRKLVRFMQYGMVAAQEALHDARWLPESENDRDATGVCMGSGIGAFEEIYNTSLAFSQSGPKKVSPYFVPKLLINLVAGHIAMKYGFGGPNHAATTACTTGAHSIGDAARFIQAGDANVMVAGGAESCIHPLAFTGFERSKSLSTTSNDDPARASRPFNHDRDGFIIGEGAAVLILEEMEHAIRRNAKIYAVLSGYGASADAHHITQPPSDGHGAFRAMQRALQSAGKQPQDVDYINAHATSTPLGDAAEAQAISRLIESGVGDGDKTGSPRSGQHNIGCWVGGTKGATGHLLGAAGAIEALFSVMALHEGKIPGTLNLTKPGDDLPKKLNFAVEPVDNVEVSTVLSNSFGFGGTNASLCFTKYQP